jgi:hypothetical protein
MTQAVTCIPALYCSQLAQLSVAAEMMREEIRQFHVELMGDRRDDDVAPWKTP